VLELFKGFSGYVQADAKSVYDALLRPSEQPPPDGEAEVRQEVACWVHCRRGLWEATAAKSVVAREGLARIGRMFELEATWRNKPPEEIHRLRQAPLRPHKAWLFVGSDDHAQSAGHLFTLIATARLHRLEPEAYLRDLLRVLAHWPRERYLELAPKSWAATRARLVAVELDAEVGELTVPEPLTAPAEQQSPPR
jgi:transposase